MGAVLLKIFKIIEAEGGVSARLKFAQKTKIGLSRVKRIKDKPAYIENFKKIAEEILGKDIDEFLPPFNGNVNDSVKPRSLVVEFDEKE